MSDRPILFSGPMVRTPDEIRATSAGAFARAAQGIVDSYPVVTVYASCEWADLTDDGKLWICAIVRETLAQAASATPTVEQGGGL